MIDVVNHPDLVKGWKAIGKRIGCSERAAERRRRWYPDPLPIWENHLGEVCAFGDALDQWCLRHFLPIEVAAQVHHATPRGRERQPVIEKRRDSRQ